MSTDGHSIARAKIAPERFHGAQLLFQRHLIKLKFSSHIVILSEELRS
jgi:hypothetical protein